MAGLRGGKYGRNASGRPYEVRFTQHFETRLVKRVPVTYHRKVRSEVRRRLNSALRVGVQPYGLDLNVMVYLLGDDFEEEYKVPCVPDSMGYWVAKTLLYVDEDEAEDEHEQKGVSMK